MDNNSPSPSISIKPKDSTMDSKFGVVVTTPNYLQFFSDVPSYYQFLKDPKNYKDLLLGTVNIGNLIRNSLSNPEFKQFVQNIVLDIEIPPSIDTDTIVTIEGEQEVKGRKDFTGGLAVNGQNLIYDPVKKVWQLTGDLVVTGAVTMFGSLSGFTPSTVTDAVLVDNETIIKVKDAQGNWVLRAPGGGGSGGGLTSDEVNILIANALTPVNKNIETKWTQDNTKIANWDSAFKWGDHSKAGYMKSTDFNTQLKQYILKDTVEQISARHNFTDGLQIDGINIYKSQDKTIYLDANLVVSGAFAMFGNNSTTFETIWKDIPFDLNTMEWTGSEWRVIGGANNIDVTTVNSLIYEYLNRTGEEYAKQSWVNQQGFAKQSALTAVDNRLTAVEVFFATEDSDTLVNKWAEIVEFLNATEGDTLDNILKTKANQSALDAVVTSLTTEIGKKWTQNDAKIANWDAAYGWGNHANAGYAAKTYVDGELAKYVKLAVAQSIEAQHNFVNGLKIGGLGITKSQDDVIYVDANLVVRGAVTMFGSGATIAPSIWASIPFNPEHMSWDGSQWNIVGGGSGSVNEATVNNLIYEYLTQNSYAKISDISSALTGYATQSWVGDNYLAKSGGVISSLTIGRGTNGYETLLLNTSTGVGFLIYEGGVNWKVSDANWSNSYSIIHSGNIGQQSVNYAANAGTLGGVALANFMTFFPGNDYVGASFNDASISEIAGSKYIEFWDSAGGWFNSQWGKVTAHSGFVGDLTGRADSAKILNYTHRENINYSVNTPALKLICDTASIWESQGFPSPYCSGISAMTDYVGWQMVSYAGDKENPYFRSLQDNGTWKAWKQLAFLTDNVASATKLQTARTIWGQSFDGSGNVDGDLYMGGATMLHTDDSDTWLNYGGSNDGKSLRLCGKEVIFQYGRGDAFTRVMTITNGGNVAIGDTTADAKLHIHYNIGTTGIEITRSGVNESSIGFANSQGRYVTGYWDGAYHIWSGSTGTRISVRDDSTTINGILNITSNNTSAIVLTDSSRQESSVAFKGTGGNEWYVGKGVGSINDFFGIYNAYKGNALVIDNNNDVTIYGNLLTTGAITMFSLLSMKNVIDYDGLSLAQLEQIRPARFTWKDGRDNRIHVGGIADEVMQILPEVIHRTSDDKLTMDYGSAAFYIGASLIKPVVELWEAKDKQQQKIESLEKRVEYLEKENRQLRAS